MQTLLTTLFTSLLVNNVYALSEISTSDPQTEDTRVTISTDISPIPCCLPMRRYFQENTCWSKGELIRGLGSILYTDADGGLVEIIDKSYYKDNGCACDNPGGIANTVFFNEDLSVEGCYKWEVNF